MDWTAALIHRLLDDPDVSALVANRIYWVDRPQLSSLPAISLQVIGESRPQHMNGFDGLDRNLVQMDVWGKSYAEVQQVKEAAIGTIIGAEEANGIKFERAFLDTVRDLGERTETQYVHRASIDLIFFHSTA